MDPQGKENPVAGNDGSGVIYGCNEIAEYVAQHGSLNVPLMQKDAPEMVLRGACVGLQKTVYLPGHQVYEYPYTPENFLGSMTRNSGSSISICS